MTDQELDVLYLDDYHAGDVLFIQSLARSLARLKERRAVLVHGAGEHAERALEAAGIFHKRTNGVIPVESAAEHALVERALRHVNQKITGALTDAVVPAVSVIGSERGLFISRGGQLQALNVAWLETLAQKAIVPVVGVFAIEEGSGRTGEVPLHLAIEAISRSFQAKTRTVVFTKTNLPGVMKGATPEPAVGTDRIDERIVADVPGVKYLVSRGISVLLTNTTRLSDKNGPIGTRIWFSA